MKPNKVAGLFLLLVIVTLTKCQDDAVLNQAVGYGKNDVQGVSCRGNSAVCLGPFSYKRCSFDGKTNTFATGSVRLCPPMTRCVNDGIEICVALKPVSPFSKYGPVGPSSSPYVVSTDGPVGSSAEPIYIGPTTEGLPSASTTPFSDAVVSLLNRTTPKADMTLPPLKLAIVALGTTPPPVESTTLTPFLTTLSYDPETTTASVETMTSLESTIPFSVESTSEAFESNNGPNETTPVPLEATIGAVSSTVLPNDKTVASIAETVQAVKPTDSLIEAIGGTVVTTALPIETTILPAETTALPLDPTVLSDETTALPAGTTTLPVEITALPVDTTIMPDETTVQPVDTTIPPVEGAALPVDTTILPNETTAQPVDTTIPPVEGAALPVETTILPDEPTVLPVGITTPSAAPTAIQVDTTAVPSRTTSLPVNMTILPAETPMNSTTVAVGDDEPLNTVTGSVESVQPKSTTINPVDATLREEMTELAIENTTTYQTDSTPVASTNLMLASDHVIAKATSTAPDDLRTISPNDVSTRNSLEPNILLHTTNKVPEDPISGQGNISIGLIDPSQEIGPGVYSDTSVNQGNNTPANPITSMNVDGASVTASNVKPNNSAAVGINDSANPSEPIHTKAPVDSYATSSLLKPNAPVEANLSVHHDSVAGPNIQENLSAPGNNNATINRQMNLTTSYDLASEVGSKVPINPINILKGSVPQGVPEITSIIHSNGLVGIPVPAYSRVPVDSLSPVNQNESTVLNAGTDPNANGGFTTQDNVKRTSAPLSPKEPVDPSAQNVPSNPQASAGVQKDALNPNGPVVSIASASPSNIPIDYNTKPNAAMLPNGFLDPTAADGKPLDTIAPVKTLDTIAPNNQIDLKPIHSINPEKPSSADPNASDSEVPVYNIANTVNRKSPAGHNPPAVSNASPIVGYNSQPNLQKLDEPSVPVSLSAAEHTSTIASTTGPKLTGDPMNSIALDSNHSDAAVIPASVNRQTIQKVDPKQDKTTLGSQGYPVIDSMSTNDNRHFGNEGIRPALSSVPFWTIDSISRSSSSSSSSKKDIRRGSSKPWSMTKIFGENSNDSLETKSVETESAMTNEGDLLKEKKKSTETDSENDDSRDDDDNAVSEYNSRERKRLVKKIISKIKEHSCKEDEVVGDIRDCKKYYRCAQDSGESKFKHMRCGNNQRFDSKSKACIHKRKAKCFNKKDLIEQMSQVRQH